ncbi:MAG: hypothetical protein ABI780_01750 [Ardenticatenales bacterium]
MIASCVVGVVLGFACSWVLVDAWFRQRERRKTEEWWAGALRTAAHAEANLAGLRRIDEAAKEPKP